LSAAFDAYLESQGIKRQLTVHNSPQQNGVAECLNRTLVERARTMLIGCNQPKFLWAEAVNYATWLKNSFPLRAIPGTTPYALVNKSKPSLAMAHEFGAKVFVHTTTGGKLEAHANAAIFVSVDEESKGYHIWWAEKCRVSIEHNVTFPPAQAPLMAIDDVLDKGDIAHLQMRKMHLKHHPLRMSSSPSQHHPPHQQLHPEHPHLFLLLLHHALLVCDHLQATVVPLMKESVLPAPQWMHQLMVILSKSIGPWRLQSLSRR
jgi:hypothetical protein